MGKAGFLKESILDTDIQNVVRELVVESEQKYRLLVENTLVGIYILCGDRFVYANPRLREIMGYSQEDLEHCTVWDAIHPDYRELVKDRAARRARGEDVPAEYEVKALRKDGSVVDILLRGVRIVLGGEPCVLGNFIDITPLKQSQRAAQELSIIVEQAPLPIIKTDAEGRITYLNSSAEQLTNSALDNVRGLPATALLHGDQAEEQHREIMRRTERGGFDGRVIARTADGNGARMRLTTFPIRNEAGELVSMVGFLVHLTTSKRRESKTK